MGLDMWCYAVRALDDDELAEIRAGGYPDNCGGCRAEDASDGMEDILPYCSKASRRIRVCDWDAMEAEAIRMHGGRAIPSLRRFARDTAVYAFDDGEEVSLDAGDYTAEEDVDCLAWHQEDLACWRKEYGMQEAVHCAYSERTGRDVQNCGYHRVDGIPAAMSAMFGGDDRPYIPAPKDGWAFFYHEWY